MELMEIKNKSIPIHIDLLTLLGRKCVIVYYGFAASEILSIL
jgi:hypothetical protein